MRKIELRTVKPSTPATQMHSMCTVLLVATASWKSTPSKVSADDAGSPAIWTVGVFVLPP